MVLFPDRWSERVRLTSLRAERLAMVLPCIQGRLLDIGAGDNLLVRLYRQNTRTDPELSQTSVGVDVEDLGSDCLILPSCRQLPFPENSFDTVSFVASLNHIPEREVALSEALRVLKPGGRLLATMISCWVGGIGHALWWYSEEKHRPVHADEVMGLDPRDLLELFQKAGFKSESKRRFLYGMNNLYIGTKSDV
jgi:ubiquinone/menaquinone biosynthesis C-methylase UbiE